MKTKVITLLQAGFINNSKIADHLGMSRQLLAQRIKYNSLTDKEIESIILLLNCHNLILS